MKANTSNLTTASCLLSLSLNEVDAKQKNSFQAENTPCMSAGNSCIKILNCKERLKLKPPVLNIKAEIFENIAEKINRYLKTLKSKNQ